jgi:GntR family transcriptional regulator/MocR family aminotransferase
MWITLEHDNGRTLARQIYQQIKRMALTGGLASGHKLPSTRTLATDLSVSRNTVIEAYSQLIAEGFLESRKGSGTTVARDLRLPSAGLPAGKRPQLRKKTPPAGEVIDFRTGIPDLEYFPRKQWADLYRDVCRQIPAGAFAYSGPAGVWALRAAVAEYLYRARGLACQPEQVMITSGSTQGLSLISSILRGKVLMENPTHPGLQGVIAAAGCVIEGLPVDDKGLRTECLRGQKEVSFIYTTPSHQYPLGGILPVQRRLELAEYAEENNCYVLEDDYDSEFRYEGRPVGSLYELNPRRVIYCGSFSKILAPALRLGFMILPSELLAACKRLKMYSDVHSDTLGQYTLARFIQSGGFEKHIWKMKKHYARKRALLLRELSKHFAGDFKTLGAASGLHLAVQFSGWPPDFAGRISAKGVRVYPAGDFYLEKGAGHNDTLILAYSHLSPDQIARGIQRMKEASVDGH